MTSFESPYEPSGGTSTHRVGPSISIEPPPRVRLEAILERLLARRDLPPPGLPQGVPRSVGGPSRSPSLLLVGEQLGEAAAARLRRRGFRKVVDVEDLPDALGALSERRYEAIAIWDHVHERTLRFVRALQSFEGRASDPLLPLLASRVRDVPIAVLHGTGGFAVLTRGGSWFLSEPDGPDWSEAVLAIGALGDR